MRGDSVTTYLPLRDYEDLQALTEGKRGKNCTVPKRTLALLLMDNLKLAEALRKAHVDVKEPEDQ